MFGPVRGPWQDTWRGWWVDEPPYRVPVFVLIHYARAPLSMKGGTTSFFITDAPEVALRQAKAAANTRDVRIGGGVATIRQYLTAGESTNCIWRSRPLWKKVLLLSYDNGRLQSTECRALVGVIVFSGDSWV